MRTLRIATVQTNTHFAPDLHAVLRKADALTAKLANIDVLVLPELAFTGYAYPSRPSVLPYLEPTARGQSTQWAKRTAARLACHVIVGYPEQGASDKIYNSAVVVAPNGSVLLNYRKTFLYSADEQWGASEGDKFAAFDMTVHKQPTGPLASVIAEESFRVRVALGICMDLNPRAFRAPFDAFEFANFAVEQDADLILMPMAWQASSPRAPDSEPDFETLQYWIKRLAPVAMQHVRKQTRTVFVACNRCGTEDSVTYAGSSCVLEFGGERKIALLGALTKGDEDVLVVDVSF